MEKDYADFEMDVIDRSIITIESEDEQQQEPEPQVQESFKQPNIYKIMTFILIILFIAWGVYEIWP